MAWNGWTVVDMDSHIIERPNEMYGAYIDPVYGDKFALFKQAIELSINQGGRGAIAASRHAVLAPVVSDNALGEPDSFGMVPREFILHPTSGRKNFGRPEHGDLPKVQEEVSWDAEAQLKGMDESSVDVDVLFPTHVSSYCALNDVGFENALYRAYHRWVSDFCAQAPTRLKWTLVANLRDPDATVEEARHWVARDPALVGLYFPPNGPDNMLLCDRRLYPIYAMAQDLDLPVLIHGGTARPPFGPGTFDLGGA